ncbi:MAG: deoxyguanosinetriphosphate triphosphohydrolase [Actinobacteria bacterium RBG_19FT_COMBO_54_7]|uniref:Deoxyguanosinetriphosphate triphosphohydrolase-like protein n=1 Tax=Candidatus Solincola sediminis TaxID=1797199 RepID=A0A1F2WFD6_9ACTN|nr:MAG: deoxyguanosinetriphosphate triphosphohydrolase [Candidatus Solincola sediminis]OFW57754.1 MAG: deoxyguanosinetriphosphate triphosphohydrolase [Candidatus Solincola sediminis]OFW65718.1 MAG: deoxyguanosinetriphosphate triphosphohydrolase [Actinobacteria bacterium RBG_19FT_COMBO_54_7]
MTTREEIERFEEQWLSPYAMSCRQSKGREREEAPDPLRTCFMRDRDRIIHNKTFRRLKHKTQVFLAPEGDHYRTRLTHTLEVSQISRTIARALHLNEDLTEAIALGHDLGHTPFGHMGEEAFRDLTPRPFHHNEQSLRVVEKLEYNGKGLNLTWEVRDGILNHTGGSLLPATLEGRIVRTADRIAYVNHDIDDAIRAGVLDAGDLPVSTTGILGRHHSQRIDTLVKDMVAESTGKDDILLSSQVGEALNELRDFLFDRVYVGSIAKQEEDKAIKVLRTLFLFYYEHPGEMPEEYQREDEDLRVRVCDYVAGMTDRYAMRKYHENFLPHVWVGEL